jgi:hypothetical protein
MLDRAGQSGSITEIAGLIGEAIPAELFTATSELLRRINELATISSDLLELMGALGPLVDVSRYGNVRKTDLSAINTLVDGLITRICIGLPNACYGLDEANAQRMFGHIRQVDQAVRLLENEALESNWHATLLILLDKAHIQAIITGCTCRLLFDNHVLEADETGRRFGLALSAGQEPAYAAGWLEGFLGGSGMILLLDQSLWRIVHKWVAELDSTQFLELMPILRRTFSQFAPGERRKLGEKARQEQPDTQSPDVLPAADRNFNPERAVKALPVVRQLLGIP